MKTQTYIAHTQPGFDAIAAQEIKAQLDGARVRGTHVVGDKNSLVLFSYAGDPRDLLQLRTVEDVFVLVATLRDLEPTFAGLKRLRAVVATLNVEPTLALARQLMPGRGGRGKLRFRVIARQVWRTSFRRVDAQQAVEKAFTARTDHRWQLAEEHALEFWLTLLPGPNMRPGAPPSRGNGEALLALRLSDAQMRHREQNKREHLPASLRPSAAAALVWLTRPRPTDVFLDPMCGAGTVLIERGEAGRYKQLLGGDIRAEAVAVAQSNIGPRYKPIELHEWDARELPLNDGFVTSCAVNLPFGKQLGSADDNRVLYPAVLRELTRVLRPAGRLVVLTGDQRAFEQALRRTPELTLRETYPVMVLGQRASVYLLERA